MNLKSLRKIAKTTITLCEDAEQNPLKYFRPTPVQEAFLRDQSRVVMLRGGNQIGKTMSGSVEVIYRLLAKHPFKPVPPPPIEAWIVCHSWEQSKTIMCKFHEMMPKNELHPDIEFVTGKGYRGTGSPVVRLKNGSIVRFKTTQSASGGRGTISLASGSCDVVWVDEPPPPNTWGELFARTTRTKGALLITMTPVGVPVEFLKKMVEEGTISEHVGALTVENTTPKGCKPMMSQVEIDKLASSYLRIDRDARIAGDWEGGIPEGRIFENFSDDLVSDLAPDPNRNYVWTIGIDHGHDIASQVAILSAIDITDQGKPLIYIVDEYVASGASAQIHAKGIIAMIRRNNLQVAMIQRWTGDRSHGGSKNNGGRMSNNMLTAALCHVLGYPKGKLPFRIRTAYKPKYSVYYGCQLINEAMCSGRFQVFPRCERTIKSLKFWQLKKSGGMDTLSEWKHCVDALRYGIMSTIDRTYRIPRQSKVKLR
tara:strand:+ start:796 stop:2238 length:1443 start_codon:yes stop_codon:yes gene_type:complete